MATITPTVTALSAERAFRYTWAGVTNADTCVPIDDMVLYADRSAQVSGTFDGGSVAIEGTIVGDVWATLTDQADNALVFSTAKIEVIAPVTTKLRPNPASLGANGSVTISVLVRRN